MDSHRHPTGSDEGPSAGLSGPPVPHPQAGVRLSLVVGALGVVFGDIGTSPIYTLQTVFDPSDPHPVPVSTESTRRRGHRTGASAMRDQLHLQRLLIGQSAHQHQARLPHPAGWTSPYIQLPRAPAW